MSKELDGLKKLGFGTLHVPIKDPKDQASFDYDVINKQVDMFLEHGFKYFDTSYIYHDKQSEIALREALVKRHPRDSYILSDKMPIKFMKGAGDVEKIFQEQLEKCGVEYFDYYLLHSINREAYETSKKWKVFEFLQKKREEGYFREFGVSLHDRPELIEEILAEHPEIDFVVLQINFVDWTNPLIDAKRTHEIACKYDKPIVVMQPCKGGTLVNNLPEEAVKLMKDYNPDASIVSWAIRFAASLKNVRVVLSSFPEMYMLEDNIKTMENFVPLNEEEFAILERVRDIINENIAVQCSGCKYCINDCPKNIPIDDFFALYNDYKRNTRSNYNSPFQSSTPNYYLNLVKGGAGRAADCVGCNKCVKRCPQALDIPELLKDVSNTFDSFDVLTVLDKDVTQDE